MRNRSIPILIHFLLLFLLGCNQNNASNLFEKAESLWESGRYEEALAYYADVVRDFPASPYAPRSLYRTGIIQSLYLFQYNKAVETFSKLTFLYPESQESLQAQKEIATIYIEKLKDYKRGIYEYQKLLDAYKARKNITYKEKGEIRFKIGLAYMQMGDVEQARIEFKELLKSYPSIPISPEVRMAIADSYFMEGNLKDAIDSYKRVITTYPDRPVNLEARFKLAVSLEETGDLKAALEEYKKLLGKYPNQDVLTLKIKGVKERIRKVKRIKG